MSFKLKQKKKIKLSKREFANQLSVVWGLKFSRNVGNSQNRNVFISLEWNNNVWGLYHQEEKTFFFLLEDSSAEATCRLKWRRITDAEKRMARSFFVLHVYEHVQHVSLGLLVIVLRPEYIPPRRNLSPLCQYTKRSGEDMNSMLAQCFDASVWWNTELLYEQTTPNRLKWVSSAQPNEHNNPLKSACLTLTLSSAANIPLCGSVWALFGLAGREQHPSVLVAAQHT